jgi:pilus assembly protein FimV
MNTSDNSKRKHENVDQFDDLTRFLDEDFDTDDVDLFEFTTEEDSPLTGLKSIVLSLDWEITDSTLQELAGEITRLKGDEMFQPDKVSQVYLQGLAKIGQYIQSEGAQAHPNAIKLLLTFYYDFEKILSSDTITGTEITALLKADVRKFKILQYQIARRHGVEAPVPAPEEAKKMGLVYTDSEALRGIRAVILELDWEVSDQGLQRLTEQLDKLKEKFPGDRHIQVLLQGLYSLKSYIAEEKGRAHPEAYTLLHTFSEGIARLIENGSLAEEERRAIIIDQVNSLNNLKTLIVDSAAKIEVLSDEAIESVEEQTGEKPGVAPAELEEEAPTVTQEVPEEELEPFTGAEAAGEDQDIAPALADETGEGEIREEEAPEELEERLEYFFGEQEKAPAPPAEEETVPAEDAGVPEAFTGEAGEDMDIEPALAGDASEGTEIKEEAPPEELTERLEFFFGGDEEVTALDEEVKVKAKEEPAAEVPSAGEDEEADEEIIPALSGAPEEAGYAVTEEEEAPEGLADKLEDFFGEKKEPPTVEETAPAEEEETAEAGFEAMFEEEEAEEETAEDEIAPALADESEQTDITEETPPEELTEKLEYFFGGEEEEPAEAAGESDGEEEVLLTSALDEAEEPIPAEAARPMKTEEEYQAAVVQIRTHFKKIEAALREEIAALKKEVEDLRARIKEE